ncbi:GntR family transcriptional regulator [Corynebacterium sp. AOP40-9SA-29]|uniref:GntR family transcriptional regulator n=1 Tax=Corynebacterium sp. AOP40-9SA-29 TaxID=3457677 RepID=UPI0040339639
MSTGGQIDRQSEVPYYQQLSVILQARISDGVLAQGDRLPSENDLCTEFGLSRATVRQSLRHLQSQGLVRRVPKRGVFVSSEPVDAGWMIQGEEGFLESALGHRHQSVDTRVIRYGGVELPEEAARDLRLPDTPQHGFELVRVRSLGDRAALYSINYNPPALVDVLAEATGVLEGRESLTALLTGAGYELGGAHRTIRSVRAPSDIAQELGIDVDEPVTYIRSVSWTPQGTYYDVYDTWVRSDVVPLEIDVRAVGAPGPVA